MISLHWRALSVAHPLLRPAAAVAVRKTAVALLCHLQLQSEAQRRHYTLYAHANSSLLMVQAEERLLPWLDGVQYAACIQRGVWTPCHVQAHLHVGSGYEPIHSEVLADACAVSGSEVLLWPDPALRLRLDAPLPASAETLEWLLGTLAVSS